MDPSNLLPTVTYQARDPISNLFVRVTVKRLKNPSQVGP